MDNTTPLSASQAMSIIDVVPEELWASNKELELIEWLKKNVQWKKSRKYIMLEWSKLNGVPYTKAHSDALQVDVFP